MASGVWLQREAERRGFRRACRPDVDETRFVYASATHVVYVTAPHTLHRGVDDPSLLRSWISDLEAARAWCDGADADETRVLIVDNVMLRPITSMEGRADQVEQSWPGKLRFATPEEQALIEHDMDLRSWPTLEEEPDA